MKSNGRSILALTNTALTRNGNHWWPAVLLVLLLSCLCFPSEARAATRDRKKPTVPTGLTATPSICSQIDLRWNASTDTGGSGLMGYKIYRNGVLLKQVLAPATQTSDSGLIATTTYSYAILAIDKAGNKSAQTLNVLATTPACCSYSLSPSGAPVGAEGGSGTITESGPICC